MKPEFYVSSKLIEIPIYALDGRHAEFDLCICGKNVL